MHAAFAYTPLGKLALDGFVESNFALEDRLFVVLGRGPERGDGTVDKEDWNNGCGNDEDRDDDNEGVCGPHRQKPESSTGIIPKTPRKPPVVIRPCKVVLWGSTPELFPAWVDVRNPDNEKFVTGAVCRVGGI